MQDFIYKIRNEKLRNFQLIQIIRNGTFFPDGEEGGEVVVNLYKEARKNKNKIQSNKHALHIYGLFSNCNSTMPLANRAES